MVSNTEESKLLWPGWETVRLIGRGSFGTVYEIQRDVLGDIEKAALKVISIPQNASDIDELYSDGYDDESITITFQSHLKSIVAEYSLMRKMNGSSNIVNCDDVRYVQHDDGIGWDIFIKMELLTPLPKALPADVQEDTVLTIAKDLCTALELCKKHDIVHRDIKPQNIFVSPNGDYKLGDFGIAKTVEKTMGGTKIGTYKYMSPEVYNNQPYGSGADIYSLGLVLYWLLNERRMPFMPLPPAKLSSGMEEAARLRRFSGEQLPPPKNGSTALKAIVLKACAYKPEDRYQSAAEMMDALAALGGNADSRTILVEQHQETQDDDHDGTVGPAWNTQSKQVATAVDSDEQADVTVGPNWKKAKNQQTAKEKAEQPQKPKRKWLFPAIAGVLVIALLIAMLRFCGNVDTPSVPSDGTTAGQQSTTQTDGTIAPTSGPVQTVPPTTAPQITEPVPVVLTGISIAQMPNKTSYTVGETLDTTGLTLKLTYSDGSTKTVASGFTCAPTRLNTEGTQTITVAYGGKTTSFDVTTKVTVLANGTHGGNLTWTLLSNGELVIAGAGEMFVPEGNIYPWTAYAQTVSKLTIQNGVTSIGDSAFLGFEALETASIPNSVVSIRYDSFSFSALKSIFIPANVSSLSPRTFDSCWNLKEILVDGRNANYCSVEGVLFNKEKTELIRCPEGKTGEYTVPAGTKIIAGAAFGGCRKLDSIQLPDSVVKINYGAFQSCSSIKNITIPRNTTFVDPAAFFGCDKLTQILVDVKNPYYMSLDGILFNKDMTDLVRYPEGRSDTYYDIPNGVQTIAGYAFWGCKNLTAVSVPDGPDGTKRIDTYAFASCVGLKEIVLRPCVESIGACAFYDCTSLTKVFIFNEKCVIKGYDDTLGEKGTTTIYGYAGSTAQAYAEKCGYNFVVVS